MVATIKGKFVKNEVIKKKDGTDYPVALVLAGDEVVKINKMQFDPNTPELSDVTINVNIKSTQYGLLITPCL